MNTGKKKNTHTQTNNQQQTKTITIIVDMLGVEYPCIKWKGKKDNEKKKKRRSPCKRMPTEGKRKLIIETSGKSDEKKKTDY